ncbi:MAG: DoxX family membrane protein [Micropruina sp.]|uniref:DoxX family protein n=1 Tax=Micropruina sp. TaxID=2737536 RepID=UPI0039E60ECA
MSLLRFAARTMLASFFVVNGVKAMRDPEPWVGPTEPLAKTFLPLAEKTLPRQAVAYLPEDARGLVRLTGFAQVVGGLSLATGIGRRLGAVVLAVSMAPQLLASNPFTGESDEAGAGKDTFLRDIALTGGVLLAAQDTEGRPDLAWRTKNRAELLGREAEHTRATISREAAHAKASLAREGKRAARKAKKVANKATKTIEGALK